MRIAAVGDLHCRADSRKTVAAALAGVQDQAEVLLLAGDLTDHGTVEEANILAEELSRVPIEKVAVLGNHDYESGREAEVAAALKAVGVHVLDGDSWMMGDLGVAGVKGFAGGFEAGQLQRFGEGPLKQFVDACIQEELKLETALFRLRTRYRIALMHYAPCRQTLQGEPVEIFAFLGATRLGNPIDQLRPAAAFHGHAHRGQLRGATRAGVPVFNVALPVLRRLEKPVGFFTFDLEAAESDVPRRRRDDAQGAAPIQ